MSEVSGPGTCKYRVNMFQKDINEILEFFERYINKKISASDLSEFYDLKGINILKIGNNEIKCDIIGTDPGKRDVIHLRSTKRLSGQGVDRLSWHLDQHERHLKGDSSIIKGPLLIDEISKAFLESKNINIKNLFDVIMSNPEFLEKNKFLLNCEDFDLSINFYMNNSWVYINSHIDSKYIWSWGTLILNDIKLPQTLISMENVKLTDVVSFDFISNSEILIESLEDQGEKLKFYTNAREENNMFIVG